MEMSLEQKLQMLKSLRSPANVVYYAVMPLGDILFVLFLGLKLGEVGKVAQWSWWWVFAPFYIPVIAALVKKYLLSVKKFMTLNTKEEPIVDVEDLE